MKLSVFISVLFGTVCATMSLGQVPVFDRLDINRDGMVYSSDAVTYKAYFEMGDLRADFNGDGFVTGDDFDTFSQEIAAAMEGWVDLRPSVDSKIYYVATWGKDTNNGESPALPFRTIRKGTSSLRFGYPDWVALERGGSWDEPIGAWRPRGRSASEPLVITAWGSLSKEKPVLVCTNTSGWDSSGGNVEYVVLQSIDFTAVRNAPNDQSSGLALINTTTSHFVVDDCSFRRFKDGVNIQGRNQFDRITGVVFNRTHVYDSYSTDKDTGGHSQGVYWIYADISMDGCVVHHNGWNEPGTDTQFNHNFYGQVGSRLRLKNSVVSYASSHGINGNGEVIADDCLVLACPIGAMLRPHGESALNRVAILYSRDIDTAPRAFGAYVNNAWTAAWEPGKVTLNSVLVANQRSTGGQAAFFIQCTNDGIRTPVLMAHCTGWDWKNTKIEFSPGKQDDPVTMSGNRMVLPGEEPAGWNPKTVEEYATSVGHPSVDAWISSALMNRRGRWSKQVTAKPAVSYLLTSYGVPR